jgi:hypothetical protein
MIELVATSIITLSSVALFVYWFRYTCLLMLSAKTAQDYAGDVAMANQLSFPEVQARLREDSATDLGGLQASLDRDFAMVTYLLEHAANPSKGSAALENKMLQINYKAMRLWFSISRSRQALEEMASVVAHFANAMGERAAMAAAA